MGMFDYVAGVPDPYDSQLKIWDRAMTRYEIGDPVPPVPFGDTYSVQLRGGPPHRYLHVCNNILTATMAEAPLDTGPVVDKWGHAIST